MLPLLKGIAYGKEHLLRDLTEQMADEFKLSAAERQELLPSGQQTVLSNRVQWAKTYLKKAGLLSQPSRGRLCITPEGQSALGRAGTLRSTTSTLRLS
jgi:restriction system protein